MYLPRLFLDICATRRAVSGKRICIKWSELQSGFLVISWQRLLLNLIFSMLVAFCVRNCSMTRLEKASFTPCIQGRVRHLYALLISMQCAGNTANEYCGKQKAINWCSDCNAYLRDVTKWCDVLTKCVITVIRYKDMWLTLMQLHVTPSPKPMVNILANIQKLQP